MKAALAGRFHFPSSKVMQYQKGKHCVFYHRYHVVWITKYRYNVLTGSIRKRVREIIQQVCSENGVEIISACCHATTCTCLCRSVDPAPSLSVSDFMRKVKGRSSHKLQMEFPALKKRYWGRHFWGLGYFSTTAGAITDDIVLQYLENHIENPTDASR